MAYSYCMPMGTTTPTTTSRRWGGDAKAFHTRNGVMLNYKKRSTTSPTPAAAGSAIANFTHLFGAVQKDWEFLKKGVVKGFDWANQVVLPTLPTPPPLPPKFVNTLNHFVWLRHLEDPLFTAPSPTPSWPQPSYPALSGMDLLLADLQALQTYAHYFYSFSTLWSTPLPDLYDAQQISLYFNSRPHLVAIRFLQVFFTFSSAVIQLRASRMRGLIISGTDMEKGETTSEYDFGKILKDSFLILGPTFIKVGQSLSTRPDIVGPEISKALSELHDRIPPFPTAVAMKIIEQELGAPTSRFFSYISEEPVAAASFGQVYRGTTCDGCDVAIKVQRPNLHHLVARDIYILRLGLGLLQKIAQRKNDIRLYADELGKGLMGELDYRLEAKNALRFLEAHSSFPFIHVPKVFRHLTRKKILTMDWVVGENPNDLLLVSTGATYDGSVYAERQKLEAKQHLLDLVSKGVEASLIQLLETGFLHADPHPGNLRYTTSGQIGFIDFGLMCQMERKHQLAMLASIIHIVNGDWVSLVQALSEMDVVQPGTNTRLVTMELENSLGEVEFNDGIPDVKFSKVLGKIFSVALKYHFRMPPYFTLLLRSLASLEGLAIAADENFRTFEAAYPYVVRKLLTDNSHASKKILHSVLLDRRREFQWKRLALFLRVGAARKHLPKVVGSAAADGTLKSSSATAENFDVAAFVLRLLPSKDGIVLRRLLVAADGSSLVRAFLSEEAAPVRQQLCKAIADVLNQWMLNVCENGISVSLPQSFGSSSSLNYQLLLRDRRLKVVLGKILNDSRRDWLLTLRFYWASAVMLMTAFAMAFHRSMVSASEAYLTRISTTPLRVMG